MDRKGMNGVIGMRAPITANQIAIKDVFSTDRRYQLAVMVLLEGFQHTLNR